MAYDHPKDPNQIIAWKKLPETLKLSDEEPPLRSLPDAAQLPAAAAMAHRELMTPSYKEALKKDLAALPMAASPSHPTLPSAFPQTPATPTTTNSKASAKRKAPEPNNSRFPTCTTGPKSFNSDRNGPASCSYHTESLVFDRDWKGRKNYDLAEGPKDSPANHDQYPKGFRFDCRDD
ncbi:hypothetical protein E8E11_009020 [Didymella keratinophila]|nr:hypothetical protein E8E11_009020 [Didymella keratinophila]